MMIDQVLDFCEYLRVAQSWLAHFCCRSLNRRLCIIFYITTLKQEKVILKVGNRRKNLVMRLSECLVKNVLLSTVKFDQTRCDDHVLIQGPHLILALLDRCDD